MSSYLLDSMKLYGELDEEELVLDFKNNASNLC